jgi:hypothetical protein
MRVGLRREELSFPGFSPDFRRTMEQTKGPMCVEGYPKDFLLFEYFSLDERWVWPIPSARVQITGLSTRHSKSDAFKSSISTSRVLPAPMAVRRAPARFVDFDVSAKISFGVMVGSARSC